LLCRLDGMPVAMRVVLTEAEMSRALREVAAYERLRGMEGDLIPRLVAHGYTMQGDGYVVATAYLEVRASQNLQMLS